MRADSAFHRSGAEISISLHEASLSVARDFLWQIANGNERT